MHFFEQKRLGVNPMAVYGSDGNLHQRCGVLDRQSAEIAKLDNLGSRRLVEFKLIECLVERQNIGKLGGIRDVVFVEIDTLHIATSFDCLFSSGIVNKYPSHRVGGGCKKMSPTFPMLGFLHVYETDIGVMHESRGLKRLARILLGHLLGG